MIQPSPTQTVTSAAADPVRPSVWGLSALELHDAFWHARGAQCVRRGERVALQRAAEVFLLLEPDQLVLFDLSELSDRLTWHSALVTRLRLVHELLDPYSEHVVLDDRGLVERIERRYRPPVHGCYRAVLTSKRRLATLWMAAESRRDGWNRVRRAVPWSRVDHVRVHGNSFRIGDPAAERDFIAGLVERWPRPDRSIEGIAEMESGVWSLQGDRLPAEVVRVGPLWLGAGRNGDGPRCLVGPDWSADAEVPPPQSATVRGIAEVELPASTRRESARGGGQMYPIVKRTMDIVISFVALVVSLPVLALIALLIILEDGRPVLFGHTRQGIGGRPFRCWKFRTMHPNAEKIARELDAYNVCDGPQVYIQDDPRVSRIGRVLRRAHLDELPQLWNVLIGQMSLVGPRPSPDDENQFCPAWRDSRLSVRPGITGLWQLERTREPGEDFQEWIKYDIEYVQQASLWLDLVILAKTARILLLGRPEKCG